MAQGERLICHSSELEDGGKGKRFSIFFGKWERQAFVVRFQGKVYGYFNECGHVPAQLDWQPGGVFDQSGVYLVCTVHGALYAPDTGRCLGGRCQGRGLQPLSVVERGGEVFLLVDKTNGNAPQ